LSALILADHGTYGELKSMFVEEASRGQGIADAITAPDRDHARSLDYQCCV
jgi:putative acetyltransferase